MESADPAAFTDCPHCHSLCVNNAILPCGHLVCRTCLLGILEQQESTCPDCGGIIPRRQGQTIGQTIDELGRDCVLEQLVHEQLVQQGDTQSVSSAASGRAGRSQTVPKTSSGQSAQTKRLLSSRVSELDKALWTVEDLRQTLQRVTTDLEEKQRLVTRYLTPGALQGEESSLTARLHRILDLCRPPSLDRLRQDVNALLRTQEVLPVGDIAGRYHFTPPTRAVQSSEASSGTNVTPSNINIERCHDVKMETHNITINIGHHLAELQVITDTNIKEAVTEALVAKVTWDGDRERELRELSERHTEEMRRVEGELEEERRRGEAALEEARRGEERARQVTQTLQTQLSEAEARGRMDKKDREKLEQRVQQMQEEQRAAEERVATLRGKLRQEKTKGDKRVADITRRYKEDKKRVEEQVMTFVIQVEDVHRQLLERQHHDEERLSDAIQRLFSQFNIRLLGTDCGLRFLFDAPVSQWVKVVEKQLEIQAVLSHLIPEDARQDVTWTEVTQYRPKAEDIDLRIGQPLPLPDTSAGQSDPVSEMPNAEHTVGNKGVEPRPPDRVMAFDPLTATPRRTFCMDNSQLKIQGDKYMPCIRSLVATDGGKIVMTDWDNDKVKIMDSRTLTIVSSLSLGVTPWGLALLHDKLLAVTPLSDYTIRLIDVTVTVKLPEQVEKVELRVVRRIKTARRYRGVGCGGQDGTLVVSCGKQGELPASVDILSRNGQVLKTVVNGETLRGLCYPWYLCVVDGVALVSEVESDCVHRVDLATGRMLSSITHDQLRSPRQVSVDHSGNLYIASTDGGCVLVMTVDGRWRTLLRGKEHGERRYVRPVSVTVTDTGVVVGWDAVGSEVTGFDLT